MHLRVTNSSTKYITNKQTASFHSFPFLSAVGILFANIKTMTRSQLRAELCVVFALFSTNINFRAEELPGARASREFFRKLKGTRHVSRPSRCLTFVSSACLSCPAGVYLHVGINANSIAREITNALARSDAR